MCLGIPMKVVEKQGDNGKVELGGTEQKVSFALVEDVKIGDYVIVHAGFAIEHLDEEGAVETMKLMNEYFDN